MRNLKLFLSKIEKARTNLVPIKMQSADYEIGEESASESEGVEKGLKRYLKKVGK